jgi:hypothetical protein
MLNHFQHILIKQFSLLLLLLIMISSVFAQNTDVCRDMVRKSYKTIDVSGTVKKGEEVTFLHYTTKINMWNKEEVPDSETEIKLYSGKKQINFLTKEVSFYSDDKDIFLVIHRSQDLIRNKAVVTKTEENFFIKQASLIKDSLIMTSMVKSCNDLTMADGSQCKKIELEPLEKAKKYYKIEKMTFFLDKTTGAIKKFQINYSKKSSIKLIENTYHEVNTKYSADLKTPVYYKFFDKQNKPLAKYKSYNYTDNTK